VGRAAGRDPELLSRALDRRTFLRAALGASAAGAAAWAFGCASGGGTHPPTATPGSAGSPAPSGSPSGAAMTPELLTSEYVAGQPNRFAVGLIANGNELVRNADVHLKFYTIGADGKTGTFRGEGDATYYELNQPGAHEHDQSTGAQVDIESIGFYVVNTPFDVAGKWGAQIDATPRDGSPPAHVEPLFDVLDKPKTPALGTVPPASQNDTFATNPDTASLCSRQPACPLHDKVIADVLGKGRPLVVQFSTPAFCTSRFCGPVLEVLLQQVPAYQDKMDFIHIEVWQDFQLQKYRPAVQEWNLPSEPYMFLMDGAGKVVGKLESIFAEEELKDALDRLAAT